jgi:hypothetical protein
LTQTTHVSCCLECDASPGECSHGCGRYLDGIVYERSEIGWSVSAAERERWDRPVLGVFRTKPADRQPRPIQELVVDLEGRLDLDSRMESMLRHAYELEPMKVTFVVEKTLDGQLRSPGGFLFKRLGEISSNGHH